MALPTVLLKAKNAISKGAQAVKTAGAVRSATSNSNEEEVKSFFGIFKTPIIIVSAIAGTILAFILVVFIAIVSIPQILVGSIFGGGSLSGNSSSGGINGNYSGDLGYIQWAVDIANDDSHGYSQANRVGNPDYDCSSLVYYSLINAGYSTDQLGTYPFTTASIPTILPQAAFERHSFVQSELQEGDILWRAGHTAMYIGNDQIVHASGYKDHPEAGDQSGQEILVQGIAGSGPWTAYYRRT